MKQRGYHQQQAIKRHYGGELRGLSLKHDPEKRMPVFGKGHAQIDQPEIFSL